MVTPGAPNWRSGLGPLLARTCTVSGAKEEEEGVGEIKREGKERKHWCRILPGTMSTTFQCECMCRTEETIRNALIMD